MSEAAALAEGDRQFGTTCAVLGGIAGLLFVLRFAS